MANKNGYKTIGDWNMYYVPKLIFLMILPYNSLKNFESFFIRKEAL
jgi:hypothetical protein